MILKDVVVTGQGQGSQDCLSLALKRFKSWCQLPSPCRDDTWTLWLWLKRSCGILGVRAKFKDASHQLHLTSFE